MGYAQRSSADSYGSEGWGFDSLPARYQGERERGGLGQPETSVHG